MRKVLVGGTFNIIHPGHIFFLEKARKQGDYLVVVVANDKTVLRNKGFMSMPAEGRRKVMESLRVVNKAVIGDEKDFMRVVRKERPDIIALGYDQKLDKNLKKQIEILGIKTVRIKARLKGYKTEDILSAFGIKEA